MAGMPTQYNKAIRSRIEWLDERIADKPEPSGYDVVERNALEWALKYIDDEERNETYRRISNDSYQKGHAKGQRSLLKFYKKTLKAAVHSGNIESLQFLLDRTTEWINDQELDVSKIDVSDELKELAE